MNRRAVLAGLVLAAAACTGQGGGGAGTTLPGTTLLAPVPAPVPVPRTEVAGTAWEGRVAVAGGLTADGGASDRLDLYDPAADAWTPGPRLPVPVHHAGLAAAGARLWLAGGYTNRPGAAWQALDGVWSLGPGEQAWRQEPPLPSPRGALALAAAGGTLVAVGGAGGAGPLCRADVLAPEADRWERAPDLATCREHLGATGAGGRVYAIAGRQGSLASNLSSVESWAPGEANWRREPDLAERRGGIAAATAGGGDGVPCVAGGEEPGGTMATVECLDGGAWRVAARLAVPRHGLAVAALGRSLHAVAGGPQPGLTVSDTHEVLSP